MEDELNRAYSQLENKKSEIVNSLSGNIFTVESGWFNGHYHKNDSGNWVRESYPIPVISVTGFCDIEIHFDRITISTKLKRDIALAYSFEKFNGYEFEAYGVEEYLIDFYSQGQTFDEMKESIITSDEKEIGFSFTFPFDEKTTIISEFVNELSLEGFYY